MGAGRGSSTALRRPIRIEEQWLIAFIFNHLAVDAAARTAPIALRISSLVAGALSGGFTR
jgi:hypothetical protein